MKKINKEITDVVFLLDRSGSMSGLESDTIGGYNSYINDMRGRNINVTTILFDDKYEMICDRENVKNVKKLNCHTYYTRGSTALLDAIGRTITHLDKRHVTKVLFVITTDGYENSSTKYNKAQIKKLIQSHDNWEFIYLGADIDAFREADSIGINASRASNYKKKKTGKLFDCLAKMTILFEEDDLE